MLTDNASNKSTKNLTVNLPKSLVEKINAFCARSGTFYSRSDFFRAAVRERLEKVFEAEMISGKIEGDTVVIPREIALPNGEKRTVLEARKILRRAG